jgi:hypothetical protein
LRHAKAPLIYYTSCSYMQELFLCSTCSAVALFIALFISIYSLCRYAAIFFPSAAALDPLGLLTFSSRLMRPRLTPLFELFTLIYLRLSTVLVYYSRWNAHLIDRQFHFVLRPPTPVPCRRDWISTHKRSQRSLVPRHILRAPPNSFSALPQRDKRVVHIWQPIRHLSRVCGHSEFH